MVRRAAHVSPWRLPDSAQTSTNLSHNLRHFPTEQRAKGSPTTATRLWARVMAVLSSFSLDRNPKSKLEEVAALPEFSSCAAMQDLLVRTVDRKMTRNCLPCTLSTLSTETPFKFRFRSSDLIRWTWS